MPRNVFALLSSHFDVVLLAPGFNTGSHISCNSLRLKLLFTIWTCVHAVVVVAVLHQTSTTFRGALCNVPRRIFSVFALAIVVHLGRLCSYILSPHVV